MVAAKGRIDMPCFLVVIIVTFQFKGSFLSRIQNRHKSFMNNILPDLCTLPSIFTKISQFPKVLTSPYIIQQAKPVV